MKMWIILQIGNLEFLKCFILRYKEDFDYNSKCSTLTKFDHALGYFFQTIEVQMKLFQSCTPKEFHTWSKANQLIMRDVQCRLQSLNIYI